MFDGGGLYVEVAASGGKWWRLKYRHGGKEKRLSLGVYPDTGLKDARAKRDAARKQLADGIDPGEYRKETKRAGEERAANSFEAVAREWLAVKKPDWTQRNFDKERNRLEKHAFPWIGGAPIAAVGVADIRPLLSRLTDKGHNVQAHRLRHELGRVFRHAIATERAKNNPADALRDTMPARQSKNYPTIVKTDEVANLLRAMDGFAGTLPVASLLRLSPLLFTRPGELRMAEWAHIELDGDAPTLTIPPSNRKLRKAEKESARTPPHIVPLSMQAVAILRTLHPLSGHGRYVFPGGRDPKRSLSDGAVNAALATIGYKGKMVGHGFRHLASTLLHELGYPKDVIESQLSHKVGGVRGVYNKAEHLPERRKMMQAWADYLDGLKAGGNVVAMRRKTA